MPHLIVEMSSNMDLPGDPAGFLTELNHVLAASGPFGLPDIKSRIAVYDHYAVAGAGPARDQGFVHLQLRILPAPDRTDELKKEVSEKLFDFLRQVFGPANAARAFSLTVEIADLHRPSYVKHAEGQLV